MRRTKAEKQQTHTRIVDVAAQHFCADGIKEVGIADLMEEAGLTHGGFYAHFQNKEALIAEVCMARSENTLQKIQRVVEHAPEGEELSAIIDFYLTAAHRDHPETGCIMPALAADVTRHSAKAREAFTQAFKNFLVQIEPFIPQTETANQRDQALALLAGMVGTILLARLIDEPDLSDQLLSMNRTLYQQHFSQPQHPSSGERMNEEPEHFRQTTNHSDQHPGPVCHDGL
jgi:TetR/AcrR family transcriptional regulator, transcriptional repressor for nem operon